MDMKRLFLFHLNVVLDVGIFKKFRYVLKIAYEDDNLRKPPEMVIILKQKVRVTSNWTRPRIWYENPMYMDSYKKKTPSHFKMQLTSLNSHSINYLSHIYGLIPLSQIGGFGSYLVSTEFNRVTLIVKGH